MALFRVLKTASWSFDMLAILSLSSGGSELRNTDIARREELRWVNARGLARTRGSKGLEDLPVVKAELKMM